MTTAFSLVCFWFTSAGGPPVDVAPKGLGPKLSASHAEEADERHVATTRLTPFRAIVLGVIEGVTEYLPISSTGHLILAQRAMGIENSSVANAYAICIQSGAIVAVLGLYWRRVRGMALGVLGRDDPGRRLALNVFVAFLPAAVFGLLFDEVIERYLFGLWPVVVAWFAGGAAILAVAWWRRNQEPGSRMNLDRLTWHGAALIGLAQCLAMWPGTSRSLVTIVGGVLVGLGLPAAVEFSFLLGVITLGAATGYKALSHGNEMFEVYGASTLLLGFLAATVSAVVAVEWMVSYLNRHGMAVFGYYRLALAASVAALLASGVLCP